MARKKPARKKPKQKEKDPKKLSHRRAAAEGIVRTKALVKHDAQPVETLGDGEGSASLLRRCLRTVQQKSPQERRKAHEKILKIIRSLSEEAINSGIGSFLEVVLPRLGHADEAIRKSARIEMFEILSKFVSRPKPVVALERQKLQKLRGINEIFFKSMQKCLRSVNYSMRHAAMDTVSRVLKDYPILLGSAFNQDYIASLVATIGEVLEASVQTAHRLDAFRCILGLARLLQDRKLGTTMQRRGLSECIYSFKQKRPQSNSLSLLEDKRYFGKIMLLMFEEYKETKQPELLGELLQGLALTISMAADEKLSDTQQLNEILTILERRSAEVL